MAKSSTEPIPETNWDEILAQVGVEIMVKYKTFGNGTVVWMDSLKKHNRVKFTAGEKQFIFPDAFIGGFLESADIFVKILNFINFYVIISMLV